ncbi:MAG: hypothetical protein M0024_07670 [Nitrospiraceae bacterium]|nr:hypothetical protein [Nitrospiraceae bacterium]
MKTKKKLGEMLLESGAIDTFQLNAALAYQSEWGGRLGSIIVRKGFLTEKQLLAVIVQQYGVESVSLADIRRPTDEAIKLVKADIAKKFSVFPLEFDGKTLRAAIADPTDLKTLDDLGFMLGVRIKPVLALESDILKAISLYYGAKREGPRQVAPAPDLQTAPKRYEEKIIGNHYEQTGGGASVPNSPGFSRKDVLSGLIDLLVDKGIITKDELVQKILLKGIHTIRFDD